MEVLRACRVDIVNVNNEGDPGSKDMEEEIT